MTQRTVCNCQKCSVGCRTMPGSLGVIDLVKIPLACRVPDEQVAQWIYDHFHQGAIYACRMTGNEVEFRVIKTITPRLVPDDTSPTGKRCVFLDDAGMCSIHAVSPYGCAMFDSHMAAEEADSRSKALTMEIMNNRFYQSITSTLEQAAPTAERRRNYEAFLDSVIDTERTTT